MRKEQRIVAVGALGGIITMVLAVTALTFTLPDPTSISNSVGERISYALFINAFAIIPLFIMLVTVGNSRFLSKAIDPTLHAETEAQEVNGRVVENTLQQNFVFFVATLALSTVVPFEYIKIILACAIVFIFARFVFWFGYRIHPLYRAPGMSATAYMNLGMLLYIFYTLFN